MLKIFFIMLIGYSTLFSYKGLKKVKFYKKFEQNHYSRAAGGTGAGVYASSYIKIDENGLKGGAYLKVKAKILGREINKNGIALLKYKASIDPTSFKNTYSDVSFYIFGKRVYISGANMYDKTGRKKVSNVKVNASKAKNKTDLKQKQRAAKMKKAKSMMDSSGDPIIGIKKDFHRYLSMADLSKTIFIGPLPLYLKFKAGGKAGVDIKAGLTGLTTLTASVTPYANINADGRAGLGAHFYKEFDCCWDTLHGTVDFGYDFGLGSSLTLLDDNFDCSLTGGLKYNANKDYITSIDVNLHEKVVNTFTAAHGKLYTFVDYYGPDLQALSDLINDGHVSKDLLDLGEHYNKKTITSFSSKKYKKTLINKTQKLFTIPLYSENDDILLYKESSCKGSDVGAFDSAYSSDVSCKDSLSCEDNKAKSLLIKKSVPAGTMIFLYDNPDKKTSSNDFAVIRVNKKLKNDVCINGFQHQTTKKEKSKGVSLAYYKTEPKCVTLSWGQQYCNTKKIKSHLTGYVSHVKIKH